MAAILENDRHLEFLCGWRFSSKEQSTGSVPLCVNFGASFQKRTIFLKFAVIRNRCHPVLTHWSYTTFALTHQRRYTRYCPRLIFKLLWTKHRNINTPKPDTDHSGYALCQWETTLLCNVVSHWLSVYPYLVEPIPHVLGLLWLVLFNDNFRILIWISHNFVLRCHFTISQCYLMAWHRTICCLNQILSRSPMAHASLALVSLRMKKIHSWGPRS